MAAVGLSRLCHEKLCRSCGGNMISSKFCLYCSEPTAWRCPECGNVTDLVHAHRYGNKVLHF